MESYMNPVILVPILLFGVGFLVYYFYRKLGIKYPRKKRGETTEDGKTEGEEEKKQQELLPLYAMVLDNADPVVRRWYWDMIPGNVVGRILEDHKTLGIQHDTEDNKKAHVLIKSLNGEGVASYSPIKIPILKDDSPVELNYDTEHPEYEIILSKLLSEDKNFMQKYGQVLWWAAVIGFIIFMMVSG